MLTTTPRFKPCAGALPRPAMRRSPSGRTSATTAITLAVPMSRPTTRSLSSLAMRWSPLLLLFRRRRRGRRDALQPHRIAVLVTQVGVLERTLEPVGDLAERRHEAGRARDHVVVAAAAELEDGAAVERRPPRAAARKRQRLDARAERRDHAVDAAEHGQHVRRAAVRADEPRQVVVLDVAEVGLE